MTVEHPFLTGNGWKGTANLKTGDRIRSCNEENVEIKDYQGAFEDFKNVVQVAGMRYFDNEPSKYMDFYLHPEKFIYNE